MFFPFPMGRTAAYGPGIAFYLTGLGINSRDFEYAVCL
jgi:hypothetical protein